MDQNLALLRRSSCLQDPGKEAPNRHPKAGAGLAGDVGST